MKLQATVRVPVFLTVRYEDDSPKWDDSRIAAFATETALHFLPQSGHVAVEESDNLAEVWLETIDDPEVEIEEPDF